MHVVKTLPTAIAGALALVLVLGIGACGKSGGTVQAPPATREGEAPSDVQAGAASDGAASGQGGSGAPAQP